MVFVNSSKVFHKNYTNLQQIVLLLLIFASFHLQNVESMCDKGTPFFLLIYKLLDVWNASVENITE